MSFDAPREPQPTADSRPADERVAGEARPRPAPGDDVAPSAGRLFVETVGCQMNLLDSELVVADLRRRGWVLTDRMAEADAILFNTCSVREHAEHKIYSQLGRLKYAKRKRPHLVIGVLGCMAQKDQTLIFERAPHVDLVVGTGQLAEIPRLVEEARTSRTRGLAVSLARNAGGRTEIAESFRSYDPLREPDMRPGPYQAFVRIMIGCDKFCTYCVVPATRGPEQSRAPSAILREAAVLAAQGVLEVTLLGQTVNSYRFVEDGRTWRLADLIAALHDVPGLRRIKFVTNYPKDMTDDLLRAVRDLPKCSQYLHVPVQSGSDDVLRAMKRGYTVAEYLEMLDRIRSTIPAASVSSDFIVGHPGETEAEFAKSVDLVERCRFKNSFVFKYSPRPGTRAFDLYADDVPEDEKRRRNNLLLDVQDEISEEDNAGFIGREVEILVEGPSKTARKRAAHAGRGEGADDREGIEDDEGTAHDDEAENRPGDTLALQLVGRTRCDRIVVFDGNPRLAGSFARIAVEDCTATTLLGRIVVHGSRPESESCDLVPLDA